MNKTALAFGFGAGLLLAAGTASAAGNCTMEIDALQQKLGIDEGANARTGPTDTGIQQPSPSAPADMSSSGSGSGLSNGSSVATNGTGSTTTDTGSMASSSGGGSTYGANADNGSSVATNNANTGANATVGPTDPGVQQPNGSSDTMSGNSTSGASSGAMSGGSSGSSTLAPTITETSRSGEMNTITPSARSSALASLEKAKLYAKSGEENACMTELGNARQQLGIQ